MSRAGEVTAKLARECDLAARISAALEERLIFPSVLLVGGAARRRAADTAFAWNPTVRGAKSEDTFIADGSRVPFRLPTPLTGRPLPAAG